MKIVFEGGKIRAGWAVPTLKMMCTAHLDFCKKVQKNESK